MVRQSVVRREIEYAEELFPLLHLQGLAKILRFRGKRHVQTSVYLVEVEGFQGWMID